MAETTIYTIARELGITPSMVSRAFNPNARISKEKRELVLETAKKYDFMPNKFASRLSMRTVCVGILINSRFSVNTEKMVSGINSAYEKLKDYKVVYEITVMNPFENTLEEYKQVLDVYKEYDGVIITGMSSSIYTGLLNGLYEANPNTVQVQAINNDAKCLFSSKHDERIASELASEFLYNCLKLSKRKNVLLITGDRDSALHKSAEEAFANACSTLGMNLIETVDMKDNEEYLESLLPDIFERHKSDIDAIYMTSGLSSPLCRFIEEGNKEIFFVSFDTHKEIKHYLEKGIISATVSQNVTKQAEVAFELLIKHIITGEECPESVYTDVQLVFKSNMNQFE